MPGLGNLNFPNANLADMQQQFQQQARDSSLLFVSDHEIVRLDHE